ncbi:hypothetical protein BJY52DRAFT_1229961 [Lactarius psammicola]|nr:hypothetical protein BJY52DRAFT_1229961 [Lactarius psammicola]
MGQEDNRAETKRVRKWFYNRYSPPEWKYIKFTHKWSTRNTFYHLHQDEVMLEVEQMSGAHPGSQAFLGSLQDATTKIWSTLSVENQQRYSNLATRWLDGAPPPHIQARMASSMILTTHEHENGSIITGIEWQKYAKMCFRGAITDADGYNAKVVQAVLRDYITTHIRYVSGKKKATIPWAKLSQDPTSWINPECVPDGFQWADPFKLHIGDMFELLKHWRQRKQDPSLLDLLPPPSPFSMEQNSANNPPSTPLGIHVPWATPTIPANPLNIGELQNQLQSLNAPEIMPSTPSSWDPTPPPTHMLGRVERQGTPSEYQAGTNNTDEKVEVDGDSHMASPVQYTDDGKNDDGRDPSEPLCLGVKFGPSSQSSLRAAIVRMAEMERGRSLKRLPEKTRKLIEETLRTNAASDGKDFLPDEPETIQVHHSSTPRAGSRAHSKGRDHLRSSAWTHLTHESGCSEELAYFREAIPVPTNIISFFSDLEKAIKCPILPPPIDLSDMEVEGNKGDEVYGVGYSVGQREDLATMIQDLREEIGRDILEGASGWSEFYLKDMIKLRVDSSIPANVQDFNDSMGMVLSALDVGLDDDLQTKGVTPSSWFHLSAALLAAMTRGVLCSGGPKVKGRVKLIPDEDHFRVAPGLGMPVTEGGRIIVMARHLAELFEQFDKGDNPPFIEYFNNLQKVTQSHIRRVVKLAAVEEYQKSTEDESTIREIVMEDMANQLINQLKDDPGAQEQVEKAVRERMMKKLETECIDNIDEWRTVYRKGLAAALRAEATARSSASAAKKSRHKWTRKQPKLKKVSLKKKSKSTFFCKKPTT